ncbi:MAG: xanthine dehydrogenase small subunit [Rhodoferax sp.]|nr:xanthine dehydrogenase small subunit [Rhodoferax sp.]
MTLPKAPTKPIRFVKGGVLHTLHDVPPQRTLLEVLREDLHQTGTKEGCGEGDCGACTVVLGQLLGGKLQMRAVNSCIKLAHSVDGMALWTVEDLAAPDGRLHPAQEALVQCHGSQCGFCTPGFVMSMAALYEQSGDKPVTREIAQQALSGNLCRCTGYRPILEAACRMQALPPMPLASAALRQQLKALAPSTEPDSAYLAPTTLADLLALRRAQPEAQLVAGCTDVGLWVTKQHRQFARVLDTTRVAELRQVDRYPHHIAIGAAVNLHDAFAALVKDRPQLQNFTDRFAGLPVRKAGTLGGNVANGSPIGDSMPLLIALGSNIVLASTRGYREMPLEALYTGYRQNCMAGDEVLAYIKVPRPQRGELARVYKISKRTEDDISAVCLALQLHIQGGKVTRASIGAGGVAATPARAHATQAALRGQPWNEITVRAAIDTLRAEFSPISDMRASGDYRRQVLGNLLWRFWLESQGETATDIHHLGLELHA